MKKVITLVCLLFMGCGQETGRETIKTDAVESVFLHSGNTYSIYVREPSGLLRHIYLPGYGENSVKIFADVPQGKPFWIDATVIYYSDGIPAKTNGELHITYGGDVKGAGWTYGKGTSGQTTPIASVKIK